MLVDVFNKSLKPLRSKRLFVFDMDGTLYTDDDLYLGSLELIQKISSRGDDYVFFTNNSSKSTFAYIERLSKFGIDAEARNLCTSVQATVAFLRKHHADELVYCMGTKSLIEGLQDEGIRVTTAFDESASVVLLGYDTELTYSKLRIVCELLTKNVAYLATNADLACPTSFGFVPDCGAIAEMIFLATGKRPKFLGKPSPYMIEEAMRLFGKTRTETVVVGDRLSTDIAAGKNAGVDSVCVLTGEAKVDDIRNGPIKPDYTVKSVLDLARLL